MKLFIVPVEKHQARRRFRDPLSHSPGFHVCLSQRSDALLSPHHTRSGSAAGTRTSDLQVVVPSSCSPLPFRSSLLLSADGVIAMNGPIRKVKMETGRLLVATSVVYMKYGIEDGSP